MDVDPRYHRHFIIRGAEVLKQIQKQFNCQISFPKQETGDTLVTLRGREENVQNAKARIEEIVDELVCYGDVGHNSYQPKQIKAPSPKTRK